MMVVLLLLPGRSGGLPGAASSVSSWAAAAAAVSSAAAAAAAAALRFVLAEMKACFDAVENSKRLFGPRLRVWMLSCSRSALSAWVVWSGW